MKRLSETAAAFFTLAGFTLTKWYIFYARLQEKSIFCKSIY